VADWKIPALVDVANTDTMGIHLIWEACTKVLEARLNRFTESYVPSVLIASALIYYLAPRVPFAWLTY
jgi:hypothetical protein